MILASVSQTEALGRAIGEQLDAGDIIALTGPLGAGKTTLARGILAGLGFSGEVASPSFAIVHRYDPPETRLTAVHVDLYRIDNPAECDELGLDECLEDGALIVEWPENGPRWLFDRALDIRLDSHGLGSRRLTVTTSPAWKERWSVA